LLLISVDKENIANIVGRMTQEKSSTIMEQYIFFQLYCNQSFKDNGLIHCDRKLT